jgi:ER-bound oxygenase mpaB/B'/Rubber oxygenase, catalytic domain
MSRYAISKRIEQLDPVTNHQEIIYLVGAFEFPFVVQRSLEFALFRTFAVPSISALLDQSGNFQQGGQKRYDDTALIIAEIAEHGYDSERGRAAIRRMNQIHHHFKIANSDYLYVLSTFVFEPIRWNRLLAWRPSTQKERLANYYFWVEIGRRMNIKNIPETYEAFEAFNIEYEKTHFKYASSNHKIAEYSLLTFLAWFPKPLRPLIRYSLYALMDEPLRAALGYPKPPRVFIWLVKKTFRLRANMIKLIPPRKKPFLYTKKANRSYPDGYTIEDIGPSQ